MTTAQCTHQVRGPKRGLIYVYDAHQCLRMVRLQPGQQDWEARCYQHRKDR